MIARNSICLALGARASVEALQMMEPTEQVSESPAAMTLPIPPPPLLVQTTEREDASSDNDRTGSPRDKRSSTVESSSSASGIKTRCTITPVYEKDISVAASTAIAGATMERSKSMRLNQLKVQGVQTRPRNSSDKASKLLGASADMWIVDIPAAKARDMQGVVSFVSSGDRTLKQEFLDGYLKGQVSEAAKVQEAIITHVRVGHGDTVAEPFSNCYPIQETEYLSAQESFDHCMELAFRTSQRNGDPIVVTLDSKGNKNDAPAAPKATTLPCVQSKQRVDGSWDVTIPQGLAQKMLREKERTSNSTRRVSLSRKTESGLGSVIKFNEQEGDTLRTTGFVQKYASEDLSLAKASILQLFWMQDGQLREATPIKPGGSVHLSYVTINQYASDAATVTEAILNLPEKAIPVVPTQKDYRTPFKTIMEDAIYFGSGDLVLRVNKTDAKKTSTVFSMKKKSKTKNS